jgi:chemotaxis protein CheC
MGTAHNMITDDERDVLQEIMNIAFGKASADLAEVINLYVVLSVPFIKVIKATDLPDYISQEIIDYSSISIVQQSFMGDFKGSALLIFPSGAGKDLISMLNADQEQSFEDSSLDLLEKETLIEIGNILIGACVGKVAELLGDTVSYSPPLVLVENHPQNAVPKSLFDPETSAVVLKTVFSFSSRDISGFLFLLTSNESVDWLKKALTDFLNQYE